MKRRGGLRPQLAMLVVACSALIASSVQVIPARAKDDAPDPTASHCVVSAQPLGTPGETPVDEECFATFAEAI